MLAFLGLKGIEPSTLCLGNISSNTTELQAFFNKRIEYILLLKKVKNKIKLSSADFQCCFANFISQIK